MTPRWLRSPLHGALCRQRQRLLRSAAGLSEGFWSVTLTAAAGAPLTEGPGTPAKYARNRHAPGPYPRAEQHAITAATSAGQ